MFVTGLGCIPVVWADSTCFRCPTCLSSTRTVPPTLLEVQVDFMGEGQSGFSSSFSSGRSGAIWYCHGAGQGARGCVGITVAAGRAGWDVVRGRDAEEHLTSWASTLNTQLCRSQPPACLSKFRNFRVGPCILIRGTGRELAWYEPLLSGFSHLAVK